MTFLKMGMPMLKPISEDLICSGFIVQIENLFFNSPCVVVFVWHVPGLLYKRANPVTADLHAPSLSVWSSLSKEGK